jgi:hypothetical protein
MNKEEEEEEEEGDDCLRKILNILAKQHYICQVSQADQTVEFYGS